MEDKKKQINTVDYHDVVKNSAWVMISNLSMGFILLLTIYASRVLGDSVFGQYIFLLSLTTLLMEISVLGTTDYASILIARDNEKADEIVANTLGLRLPFTLLFLIISELIAWITMPEAVLACFFIAGDWAIRTIIHLLRGVLRSLNAFSVDAKVATIERLSVLLCAGIALLIKASLVSFALGFLIGRLVGLVFCAFSYSALGRKLYFAFNRAQWKVLFRGGTPIGIRGILKGISFRIDAIMLGIISIPQEVGWYGAAYKFLEASFLFQDSVGSALQPPIAKAYGQGNKKLASDLYGRGYKLLLVMGSVLAGLGFVFSDFIVLSVFGEEYIKSANALNLLVWAMVAMFASYTSMVLLDAVDFGSKTILPFALAGAGNIVLNAFLIPSIGYLGCAWSTFITEVFLAIYLMQIVKKGGYNFPNNWKVGPILACAFYTIIMWIFYSINWILVGVTLGILSFIVIIIASKVFDGIDKDYTYFVIKNKLLKLSTLFR